jgi:Phage integrase family
LRRGPVGVRALTVGHVFSPLQFDPENSAGSVRGGPAVPIACASLVPQGPDTAATIPLRFPADARAKSCAVTKLYRRAEMLGASAPEHFLLPADLSRHVKANDPLKGKKGFDPTRHQESWRTAWLNLRKAAGLEKVRFHDLRHTFITRLAENNVPLPVVRSMVGHMTAAVTERYTHISTNAARAAVDLLGKIHPQAHFVDSFVDGKNRSESKLLKIRARAVSSVG